VYSCGHNSHQNANASSSTAPAAHGHAAHVRLLVDSGVHIATGAPVRSLALV